jgi:hypothetical protein
MSRDRDVDEGFAGRWSRLKREAKAAPPEREAAVPPAEDGRPDEEILKELGLPDPDTLKPGDDFAAFMAAAVPARIRNRALRRLWTSRPVFANLDGLVDYAEDYSDKAKVPKVLETAYRVGRGWLEETEHQERGQGASAPGPASEAAAAEAPPEMAAPEPPAAEPGAEAPAAVASTAPEQRPRPRRRMRFRFADE